MSNANITVYHVTTDNVEQEHMRGTLWRKSGLNEPTYVDVPKCAKYLGEKYRLRFGLGQFINEQNIEFQLSDILYEYSDLHKVLMPSVLHTTHMNVYKLQNESYYLFVPNPSLGDDITFFFGWDRVNRVRTLTSRSVVRKHKKEVAQTLKPVYIYFENPER